MKKKNHVENFFVLRTIVQDALYEGQTGYQSENHELFKTCLEILNNSEGRTESDDNNSKSSSSSEKSLGNDPLKSTELGTEVLQNFSTLLTNLHNFTSIK